MHMKESWNWDGLVASNDGPQRTQPPNWDLAALNYGLHCTTLPSVVFVGTATVGLYPLVSVMREEISHNAECGQRRQSVSVRVSGFEALMGVKTQHGVISVGDDDGRG